MPKKNRRPGKYKKTRTGVQGLDEITEGGLPSGRATLLLGQAGSGKTVLALQMLVNGAREYEEPGIFVAFEENSQRIMANVSDFGWDLPGLNGSMFEIFEAQPSLDWVQSGEFDLLGLLAALDAKVEAMDAKRIVFDSVDALTSLLQDPAAERREIYRLHQWLLERNLTAAITAKIHEINPANSQHFEFMQYMVDCSIKLNHRVYQGVSQRSLRVVKYRGSAFLENEAPMVIGRHGVEVAGSDVMSGSSREVTRERVSTGIDRLDNMLHGGYFRGASILVTGSPGTAKTTLAGTFLQAACKRKEKALFVSFDSEADEIIRNLESVGVDLSGFRDQRILHFSSSRTSTSSAEAHLMRLKRLGEEYRPRCLVVDPVSAIGKSGNELYARSVVERLTDWAKSRGITTLFTSLLDSENPDHEGSSVEVSTIADTWIHLNYQIAAGERNRGLTIIKSRGTGHSNQVRELVLKQSGITLANVYAAEGEVLMGTMRLQKEQSERAEKKKKDLEIRRRQAAIETEKAELLNRMENLQNEISRKEQELKLFLEMEEERQSLEEQKSHEMEAMREGQIDSDDLRDSNGGDSP